MTTLSKLRERLATGSHTPGMPMVVVAVLADLLKLLEHEREETAERFTQPLVPEAPRDAQPERLPDANPYQALLLRLKSDTTQRAVAAVVLELLEHLAHDAQVFETAIGRGPAAYLDRVGVQTEAPRDVQPQRLLAEPVLPDGWRWGETDGPDTVRAYRDHVDGGYCRFERHYGFSELRAAPDVRAAVEARARRLGLLAGEPSAEPVLPPGCRLEPNGPRGLVMVAGRYGFMHHGTDAEDAAAKAWHSFGAFLSREDYEALAQDRRTLKGAGETLRAVQAVLDRAGVREAGTMEQQVIRLVEQRDRAIGHANGEEVARLRSELAVAQTRDEVTLLHRRYDDLREQLHRARRERDEALAALGKAQP